MQTDTLAGDDSRWTAVLDRDAGLGRALRLRGGLDRDLLPALVPLAAAPAQPGALLLDAGRGGDRGLPGLPPVRAPQERARRPPPGPRGAGYLDRHLDETVTLERLGAAVGLSPYHLQRSFRGRPACRPRPTPDARRMERMKSRLRKGDTVTPRDLRRGLLLAPAEPTISAAPGLGMTPAAYRRGGAGLRIRLHYAADRRSGVLLVAATDRGLCAVTLGDSAKALEDGLRDEYPAARIEAGDDQLRAWTAAVVDRLEGERHEAARPPLDLQGTAFQLRVWEELQRIPMGTTRSYSEVARAIGQPAAARAVAGACAEPSRGRDTLPSRGRVRPASWAAIGGDTERKRSHPGSGKDGRSAQEDGGEAAPAPGRRTAPASSPR